jgi:multicomponent Na+:H+ antiporter subunit E
MTRAYYFVHYLVVFMKALVLANIDVAKKALTPTLRIRPGFLAVPMKAASDFEITSLANSITLTPGTISVHIARDHSKIVIHALDVGDDPDAVRKDVQETLEANLLKWTR